MQQAIGVDERVFAGDALELHAGDRVLVVAHGMLGGADGKGETVGARALMKQRKVVVRAGEAVGAEGSYSSLGKRDYKVWGKFVWKKAGSVESTSVSLTQKCKRE